MSKSEAKRQRWSAAGGDGRPTHFSNTALRVDTRDAHQGKERRQRDGKMEEESGLPQWVTAA